MADWTLMKPINDLYALQSRVMKVELTLDEYITSGKKNILSGTDNFDNLFARLEEVHNGKREFIMDGNIPLSKKKKYKLFFIGRGKRILEKYSY